MGPFGFKIAEHKLCLSDFLGRRRNLFCKPAISHQSGMIIYRLSLFSILKQNLDVFYSIRTNSDNDPGEKVKELAIEGGQHTTDNANSLEEKAVLQTFSGKPSVRYDNITFVLHE